MIERFNSRVSEVLHTTRFRNSTELHDTLMRYVKVYNQQIPQQALGYRSPIEALKHWAEKRPDLFKKRVYNLRGLDS